MMSVYDANTFLAPLLEWVEQPFRHPMQEGQLLREDDPRLIW